MKRNRVYFLCISFVFFLVLSSCGGLGEQTPPTDFHKDKIDTFLETKSIKAEVASCFVWKKNGIYLTGNNQTKIHLVYGQAVKVIHRNEIDKAEIIWNSDTISFEENLYLLPIPAFPYIGDGGGKNVKDYVDNCRARGYKMNFKKKQIKEYEGDQEYTFEIPVINIQQSFIVLKRVFEIPETYKFPTKKKEILATPSEENPANKNRQAGYITQIFETKKDTAGHITELEWFDDDEVGYIRVKMSLLSDKTVFKVKGGGH